MLWGAQKMLCGILGREPGDRSPFAYLTQDRFIVVSSVDKIFPMY